jgi:uncharacterized membrane protein
MRIQTLLPQRQFPLMALTVFTFCLIAFRMIVTHSIVYGFLVINLALAIVPFLVSSALLLYPKTRSNKFYLAAISGVWLLFLPNAPYIITDFLHFKRFSSMPEWFDILMLISFSWTGIAFGFISLRQMQQIWQSTFSPAISQIFIFICCLLSGFGIYLGRFMRYNSWDIISHPVDLLTDIPLLLFQLKAIGFSLGYGVFFYLFYSFFHYSKNN